MKREVLGLKECGECNIVRPSTSCKFASDGWLLQLPEVSFAPLPEKCEGSSVAQV